MSECDLLLWRVIAWRTMKTRLTRLSLNWRPSDEFSFRELRYRTTFWSTTVWFTLSTATSLVTIFALLMIRMMTHWHMHFGWWSEEDPQLAVPFFCWAKSVTGWLLRQGGSYWQMVAAEYFGTFELFYGILVKLLLPFLCYCGVITASHLALSQLQM